MNKITIFAIVFASLAGIGLLGNLITLSVQPFGIFGSLSELVGSKCSCNDGQGNFSPENCEQFGGVYDDPNLVCVTLQPEENYYGLPPAEAQGCSASFWMDNSEVSYLSVWPAGYSPDYYYNTMFQTSIQLSDLAQTVNDEKEQENSEVFGINEMTSDVELPEETDEISSEETGEESVVAGEESVVAGEETGEESVVAGEESVVAGEETGEESVVAGEETGEESVVAGEETGEESVVAGEETGEESVVAGEETGEESVVAGEESVVAGEEGVVAGEDQNTNGLTIIQALTLQDGKLNLLLRESVAAMLNAAHPDVKYPYTVPQIMTMTQIAIANENYDDTLNLLKTLNDKDNSPLCSAPGTLLTP